MRSQNNCNRTMTAKRKKPVQASPKPASETGERVVTMADMEAMARRIFDKADGKAGVKAKPRQ